MIDLHSHTTASDGQHSADELMAMAAAAGVKTLAVTDHDTVAGLAAAQVAAARHGVALVPGIEVSAFIHDREVHILGHFVDPAHPELARFSERLRQEREDRMRQMVARMQKLGFPVEFEQVLALANGAQLGRPHLARLLVDQNWCVDLHEAFDRFLGTGKPAWVDRLRISAEEAIRLIQAGGGAATVAHPAVSKVERADLQRMKAASLAGVEVYHSDHGSPARAKYEALAKSLDLVPTAGSDFHGERMAPGRKLGTASMSPEELEALRARATRPVGPLS